MTAMSQAVSSPADKAPGFRITGWHVLIGVVAFFAVVIAVDVLFITMAFRTFSGEVASNPYEAGLAYNRTLAEERAQAALGWKVAMSRPDNATVEIAISDREGRPVSGLTGEAVFDRPATEAGRRQVAVQAAGPGLYRLTVPEASGAWDIRATFKRQDGQQFKVEQRLVWR
ncbi:MAG: FixH family protein [Caulobacter sp.]|nr:FixH family protein [Caulobacter sp.]